MGLGSAYSRAVQWLIGPGGWCVLSALLFGASTPFCKPLLEHMGPFSLAAFLYLGAGLVTLPISLRRRERTPKKGDKWRILGAVIFGGILGPVLLLYGLKIGHAGTAALLLNLESVATALLGWAIFREHVSGRSWFAALLVFIGGVLLALPLESADFTAALWITAACFCWGVDNHLTAEIVEFSPAETTCIKGWCAGAVNFGIAYFVAESMTSFDLSHLAYALLIGAACYGGSIVLYVAAAQQLGATHAQVIFSSSPYWGLGLAWFWLGEPISGDQCTAVALMVASVWLVQREDHGHRHEHPAEVHTHWHSHDRQHHDHVHRPGMWSLLGWHFHRHEHEAVEHTHEHRSDIHHRHH